MQFAMEVVGRRRAYGMIPPTDGFDCNGPTFCVKQLIVSLTGLPIQAYYTRRQSPEEHMPDLVPTFGPPLVVRRMWRLLREVGGTLAKNFRQRDDRQYRGSPGHEGIHNIPTLCLLALPRLGSCRRPRQGRFRRQ